MSGDQGSALLLEEAAGLLGAYCAIERRLFEVTGEAAVRPEAPAEAAALLSSVSAEHAWHAEVWADRLPVLGSMDSAALAVVPVPVAATLDQLALAGPFDQVVGLFRVVVPRLIASYARHEALASPVCDAPTRRALRLVLRDETEEWVAGEALVQGLLHGPDEVAAAGAAASGLESQLVASGQRTGLVEWPGRRA